MRLYFFRTSALCIELAKDQITPKMAAYYLLAGFVFSIFVGYSALTGSNSGISWVAFYELILLLFITIYGIERCFRESSEFGAVYFLQDFVCLSFPLTISTTVLVWGAYWVFWLSFDKFISLLSFETAQATDHFIALSQDLSWLSIVVAVCAANGIFYIRMASALRRLNQLRLSNSI